MALSRARRNFRRFLYVLLGLSVIFVATAGYYRSSFKRTKEIAPILFQIDAGQLQMRAFFSGDDGKYNIAMQLIGLGFYSEAYSNPGYEIIDSLIADDYAPAQMFRANYLINVHHPKATADAITLYNLAADQGHQPAIDAMIELGLVP
ncbi:hypothetical protein N9Z27_03075 [Alphaproteobacteria bacterium]|nr:hypothetical protein [Alphaproteobacteria bacterium]